MTTLKKFTIPAAIFCLALTVATSCSDKNKDSKELAEETNKENLDHQGEKEADKLVDIYSANMYEIKLSENAALNATTPEAKKIATMIVEAHTKMNTEVKQLADSKAVTLPMDLTDGQKKDIEKITEKSGIDYDKAYLSDMKDKHESALSELQKINEKCDDAEMKSWAGTAAPEVSSHLEMVKAAQESIKDKK